MRPRADMRSLRVILLALVAALAVGAWFVQRGGREGDERRATEPPPAIDLEPAREGAELVSPADEARTAVTAGTAAPFSEADPLDGEGLIEIRDASSAPLAFAAWVVFRGEEVLANQMTSSDGLARFPLSSGEGELAVVPQGAPLQRLALDLAAAHQVVQLSPLAAVAGRVEVDGAAPAEPLELALKTEVDLVGGLPLTVATALYVRPEPPGVREVLTTAGGAFRFDGLSPAWSGNLSWPKGLFLALDPSSHEIVFDRSRVDLSAPDADLRLALTAGSRLTGTVIDPRTGAGFKADVWAEFTLSHGGSSGHGITAQPDGAFALILPHLLPEHIELSVSNNGAGKRTVGFDLPAGGRTYDVGAIETLPTRTIAFEVRGQGGQPIKAARVRPVPLEQGGAWSDAEGRGTVVVSSGARRLRAAAVGFAPAEVDLPPGSEPVELVLQGGTVLEVRLPPGGPLFAVEIRGSEPPFDGPDGPSWSPEVGGAETQSTWGSGEGLVSFRGLKEGLCVLTGIRPGIPLTVRAVDRVGTPAVEALVDPLQPGERRRLDLAVTAAPRVLAGRVVSSAGDPVANANVSVGAVGTQWLSGTLTDASGGFRFDGLYAPQVRLVVAAQGYATLAIEEQRIGDAPLNLVLDAGRTVRVSVLGPAGAPIPNASVSVRTGASVVGTTSDLSASGAYELEHAPAAACTLVVDAGGGQFTRPLAAGETEATIEVPAWRPCEVRVEGWGGIPMSASAYVVLRSLDLNPPRLQHRSRMDPSEAVARFDVVFPGRCEVYVGRRSAPAYQEERLSSAVEIVVAPDASGTPISVTLVVDKP